MFRTLTLLSVAALAAAPLAAQDAPAQQPAQQTPPTQEQVQKAADYYSVIAGALQAEDVDAPIKNQLFFCLYSASMREIADNVTSVLANNEQLDPENPQHVQAAIAAVCGVRPPEGEEGAAETPAPSGTPEGR